MDELTLTLVSLLATTDALFTPLRWTSNSAKLAAAIEEQRVAYRRAGLPVTGGGSVSARKAHSRELAAAREGGYIETFGRTRITARLTPVADDYMRALVAGYRVHESWPLLQLVHVLTAAGQHNAGCVLETEILGTDYERLRRDPRGHAQLGRLDLKAAPLLASDLLRSASDVDGCIGYSLTADGRRLLRAGKPEERDELPDYSPEAGEAYDEFFATALADRDTWRPETTLIVVPLGAGSWPTRVSP